jgi:retinol-binding protein 3
MKGIVRGGLAAFAGLIAWAGVGAQSPATTSASDLDATVRAEVVDALAKRLASSYAVAEAGEKMAEAVRSKLAAGAYDRLLSPEELARALHADVRAVVDDRHLRVTFDGARPGARPDRPPAVRPDARSGAIGRLEVLAGNIGYMEVSGVPPRANAAIDAAFAFLRNTDALIIDLRGNGGGWPETVAYYMSYLSEGAPYTVVRVHDRQQGVIETKTTDLGERSYGKKKPVYVLTSVFTFSGGEEFAYDVQAFKRGIIVGQTTGGGANPGGPHSLGHGFTVFVPMGLVKHPATGANWEGVGVKPDVPVAPELALLEAQRLAAELLAAAASDARHSQVLRTIAAGLAEQKRIASAASSSPLTKSQMQLVGRYTPVGGSGPAYSVIEKQGHLVLQPGGPRPPSRLEQVSAGAFHLVGLPDDFTATFTAGPAGKRRLLLQQSTAWPPLLLEQQ